MFATIICGKGEDVVEVELVELEDPEAALVLFEPDAEPTVKVSVEVTVSVVGGGGLGAGAVGLKSERATDAIPPTTNTTPSVRESARNCLRGLSFSPSGFPSPVSGGALFSRPSSSAPELDAIISSNPR
jgi:hypothetical protein